MHIIAFVSEKYIFWHLSPHFRQAALCREDLSLAGLEPTGNCDKNKRAAQFWWLWCIWCTWHLPLAVERVCRATLLSCPAPRQCCSLSDGGETGPARSQQKTTSAACVESLPRTVFHLSVRGFVIWFSIRLLLLKCRLQRQASGSQRACWTTLYETLLAWDLKNLEWYLFY